MAQMDLSIKWKLEKLEIEVQHSIVNELTIY